MSDEFHPLNLDRMARNAAHSWRSWARRLRRGQAGSENPFVFERTVASRTGFQAMLDLHEGDPLRRPLLRWIYRLSEQRINGALLENIETIRRVALHRIDDPERGEFSLADLLARALRDRQRRRGYLERFFERAEELASAEQLLWERRLEIARRMGLDSPDAIERACPESHEVAQRWLTRTQDLWREFQRPELADHLDQTLGVEAAHGWPGRLSARSLGELLDEAGLLRELPLDPGEFPVPIAGSSYLRGLLRLGAGFVDATAPKRQPFVVAHDPYGLERRTSGALFALLTLNPDFARRKLGLSSARFADQQRVLARVVLAETRAAALRLQLRGAALAGRKSFCSAFEEQLGEVFGLGLPPTLAGSIYRLHVDDDQRLCGWLLAGARNERLIADHDIDWYRNPRACEELRSLADLSPEPTVAASRLDEAADRSFHILHEALR